MVHDADPGLPIDWKRNLGLPLTSMAELMILEKKITLGSPEFEQTARDDLVRIE